MATVTSRFAISGLSVLLTLRATSSLRIGYYDDFLKSRKNRIRTRTAAASRDGTTSRHSFCVTEGQKSSGFVSARRPHPDSSSNISHRSDVCPHHEAPPTIAEGLVMASQANFVRVKVEKLEGYSGDPPKSLLLCVVRAWLKKVKREVLVGDRVRIVGIDWADGRGMVEEVLPRTSRLDEPPVANISQVLLVFSLDRPQFQPVSATRYLIAVEAAGLPVLIALNKADLVSDDEVEVHERRIEEWGYPIMTASVATGRGLPELEKALRGTVSVVAGPSGAGKSSIINALRLRALRSPWSENGTESDAKDAFGTFASSASSGPQIELQAVGEVSKRIGRGRHTTRNVSLVEMEGGGLLADTPGFNQPSLSLPPSKLSEYFPEIRRIREVKGPCAFNNCLHLSEPGCVVREGEDWERYPLYASLIEELKIVEATKIERSVAKRVREGSVRYKARAGGRMAAEARLETKSHRRVNRRAVRQALTEVAKEAEGNVDDDTDGKLFSL